LLKTLIYCIILPFIKWWCMGRDFEERQGQEMGDANVPPERILGQLFLEKLNSTHISLLSPRFRASDICCCNVVAYLFFAPFPVWIRARFDSFSNHHLFESPKVDLPCRLHFKRHTS
jgi:hypothetical protein